MPLLVEKFRTNLARRFPAKQQAAILDVALDAKKLAATPVHAGFRQQGGLNVYSLKLDDHLVTVLGEAPARTCTSALSAAQWVSSTPLALAKE